MDGWEREIGRALGGGDQAIASGCLVDSPLAGHFVEDGAESSGSDAAGLAQLCKAKWLRAVCEDGLDLVRQGWSCRGLGSVRLVQCTQSEARLGAQADRQIGHAGGCAMFDGEDQTLGTATEVEVRVAPGVELGAAAQGLARPSLRPRPCARGGPR